MSNVIPSEVYVVYTGDRAIPILGVFTTRELAEQSLKAIDKHYDIEIWEVNPEFHDVVHVLALIV